MIFLRGKLIFKGATSRQGVYNTITRLIMEPDAPVLKAYLIIATAYMRRSLFVNNGCLLERMLGQYDWCRVMFRSVVIVLPRWIKCNQLLTDTRRCPTLSYFT